MARPCFKLEKIHPDPVAGVDEAGCAPLAGPVVAAAVILDRNRFPRGIDDSKALPAPVREAICAQALQGGGDRRRHRHVEEIDRLNIFWARMLAMSRAVDALGLDPAMVLVDGNRCPRWERPSRRDRRRRRQMPLDRRRLDRRQGDPRPDHGRHAREHPGYGWETNKGYPTPEHCRALRRARPDAAPPPQLRAGPATYASSL